MAWMSYLYTGFVPKAFYASGKIVAGIKLNIWDRRKSENVRVKGALMREAKKTTEKILILIQVCTFLSLVAIGPPIEPDTEYGGVQRFL